MVDGSNAQLFPQYNLAQAGIYPDLTQLSNPYSSFGGSGQLPGWPTQYAGTPNNAATGQPIQPQPGMTLNSGPQAPQQPAAPQQPQMRYQQLSPGGMMPTGQNTGLEHPQYTPATYGYVPVPGSQQQSAAASAPSMQPASQGGSYGNALSLLANPGNPTTPGAAFNPATQTGGASQGQGVLNNFLQNWQQGGIGQQAAPGLGGGSSGVSFGANNPFFAALGGQR